MNRAAHSVTTLCRLLAVSPSGYYAWRQRPTSARAREDAALTERIRAQHARSRGTYGVPRIHTDLVAKGWRVGRKRVARLMRGARLRGVSRRRFAVTTQSDQRVRPAPDRVERFFTADAPDRLYVGDITYILTGEGFLYLATVLDVFSRRVVGWAMADHLPTERVLDALGWRWSSDGRRRSSTIATRDVSTPRWPLWSAAGRPGSLSPWARWATATTTPWKQYGMHHVFGRRPLLADTGTSRNRTKLKVVARAEGLRSCGVSGFESVHSIRPPGWLGFAA